MGGKGKEGEGKEAGADAKSDAKDDAKATEGEDKRTTKRLHPLLRSASARPTW